MSFAQRMQNLFETTPGCRTIVLGDLEAGVVLRACAEREQGQEHHDALVAEAATLFDAAVDDSAMPAAGWTEPHLAAIRFTPCEVRLFAAAADEGADVLCARAAPDAALPELQVGLRALLDHDA